MLLHYVNNIQTKINVKKKIIHLQPRNVVKLLIIKSVLYTGVDETKYTPI